MDIMEASSDNENEDEHSNKNPGKSHKKTNTPQVPSMILIPASTSTTCIAPTIREPNLKHQSHCPMSVRSSCTLVHPDHSSLYYRCKIFCFDEWWHGTAAYCALRATRSSAVPRHHPSKQKCFVSKIFKIHSSLYYRCAIFISKNLQNCLCNCSLVILVLAGPRWPRPLYAPFIDVWHRLLTAHQGSLQMHWTKMVY